MRFRRRRNFYSLAGHPPARPRTPASYNGRRAASQAERHRLLDRAGLGPARLLRSRRRVAAVARFRVPLSADGGHHARLPPPLRAPRTRALAARPLRAGLARHLRDAEGAAVVGGQPRLPPPERRRRGRSPQPAPGRLLPGSRRLVPAPGALGDAAPRQPGGAPLLPLPGDRLARALLRGAADAAGLRDVRDRRLAVAGLGLLRADVHPGPRDVRDQHREPPVGHPPLRHARRVATTR